MAVLRETLLPSQLYKGVGEAEAMMYPFKKVLGHLRYIDQKNDMEVAEHKRRVAEVEAEQRRLQNRG